MSYYFEIWVITPLTTIILLFLLYKYKLLPNRRNNSLYRIPPGPWSLPFLGNLLQIVKNPHLKLSQWANHYGPLYTIYLGTRQTLVVSDPKILKELLNQFPATGKFKTDTWLLVSQGPYGMLNTEGKDWVEQRQFFMKTVVQFGFGSSTLEQLIISEIEQVCEWIEKQDGKPVIFNDVLKSASINSLWTIVSGERVSQDDQRVVDLVDNSMDALQLTVKTGLGFYPWLKNIAPTLSGYVPLDKACKDVHHFVEEHFEEHKKSIVEGSPRDVIDAYIDHVNSVTRAGKRSSTFYGQLGFMNSVSAIVEIFFAGGNTSSSTMNWMMFYFSHYPEMQDKLKMEIDEIIGQERDPCLADKSRMPYVERVILETLRYSSIGPMGIMHRLLDNIQFKEFTLPSKMLLIANIYHCHHSTEIWGDPQNFRPDRFLENENLKENIVSFQPGKRSCPGEPVVKDFLFLFVAKFFQKWKVAPHPNVTKEEYFSPNVGLALLPKRLEVIVTKRN